MLGGRGAATGPPLGWRERPDFRETWCLLSKTTGAVDPTSPGTCPAFPGLVVLFPPRLQEIVPDVKERGNSLPLIINHELGCDQNLSETKKKIKNPPFPFSTSSYTGVLLGNRGRV